MAEPKLAQPTPIDRIRITLVLKPGSGPHGLKLAGRPDKTVTSSPLTKGIQDILSQHGTSMEPIFKTTSVKASPMEGTTSEMTAQVVA